MPNTITTTVDLTYLRVGVSLSADPLSENRPTLMYRVHQDGSRNLVRGMSDLSGGVAFGWDYEAPLGVPFGYEWIDLGLVLATTDTDTVLPAPAWDYASLTVPGLPSFGGQIIPAGKPVIRRPRPTATLSVIGRTVPIVKSDVMKAPAFTLDVHTLTDADAYTLSATLSVASVLLLRMPGTRVTDWCYVSLVGDVEEKPGVFYKDRPDSGRSDGQFSTWTLPFQVVDSPVGGVFGDPTATYQASLDQFATYADRAAAHSTYLDALRG